MQVRDEKVRIGIGDIIIYRSLFLRMIELGLCTHINVYPDYRGLYWRSEKYKSFVEQLCKIFFPESCFTVKLEDREGISKGWNDFFNETGSCKKLDCSQILGLSDAISKPYICISTKIRGIPFDTYKKWNESISLTLSRLAKKYEIVLTGEKIVENNPEYAIHNKTTPQVYSIYQDLKHIFPKSLDETISQLGITPPTLEKFLFDCRLMHRAKCTINFGFGGNVFLSSAIGTTINLLEHLTSENLYVPTIMEQLFYDVFCTNSPDVFRQKVWSL